MILRPGLRKFALAVHLTASVGWIGAVVAYLALVVAAMTTQQAQTVRAAWIAMDLALRFAIVPLALASLLTGLVMSLGTMWGLFRHYWVLFSLVLTIFATVILLNHVPDVTTYAAAVAETDRPDLGDLGGELTHTDAAGARQHQGQREDRASGVGDELLHAGGGLLGLLVVQLLNVYKPRGLTPYGWRREQADRRRRQENAGPEAQEAAG